MMIFYWKWPIILQFRYYLAHGVRGMYEEGKLFIYIYIYIYIYTYKLCLYIYIQTWRFSIDYSYTNLNLNILLRNDDICIYIGNGHGPGSVGAQATANFCWNGRFLGVFCIEKAAISIENRILPTTNHCIVRDASDWSLRDLLVSAGSGRDESVSHGADHVWPVAGRRHAHLQVNYYVLKMMDFRSTWWCFTISC